MTSTVTLDGDGFRGSERFLVLRRLGSGGAGVVYEAYDREQGGRIALKVLKRLQPDALLRFKNEFRALQDINHPNLASLGELFEDGGQWFFTMEFVEGTDLLSYVSRFSRRPGSMTTEDRTIADTLVDSPAPFRRSPSEPGMPRPERGERADLSERALSRITPFDERKLRGVLPQLVRGVRALHAAGKVHRDIKASNILVAHDGRVVLLDFGLIMDTDRAREEAETHMVVGTEKYMAPEQAAALQVGPQADCYSIGVVLYRSLTGQFPFGEATGDRLVAKQRHRPAAPTDLVDGVPADLNDLCLDLLRPHPSARPGCDQILERLNEKPWEDADGWKPPTGEQSVAPPPASSEGPFVGRDLELAILHDAFDETMRGATCAIGDVGESGVGKSTLVRRFTALVSEESNALVLSNRCYERESVPYKALDGIIDALSRVLARMAAMDLAELIPRRAGLLAQAFPVLRRVRPFAEASDPARGATEGSVDPKERRAQLFGAVREMLSRLAGQVPLVLVIDDIQWSDADSIALLRDLLRPPDAPALLLLATARAAGETVPEDVLGALGDVRTLRLDRLEPDDARRLARKLLARVPWGGEEMAERVAREADGHPLFIDALVRHALGGGEERARNVRLEDALAARVGRLEDAQRQVLEAVAVGGGPLRLDVVAHATSGELAGLARAVARLRIANLVRASGIRRVDLLDTYHDRVRGAVLAHLDDEARRAWHRRIAMAIEVCAPSDVDGLVTHWRGARDGARASRYALMAAAHASDAFAFDRAARMYKIALASEAGGADGDAGGGSDAPRAGELDAESRARPVARARSSPSDLRAIRTNLAIALVNAGRGAEAAEAFLAAAEGATPDEAIDLKRRGAEQLLFSGHFDEGLAVLREVLAAMGMELPKTSRSALASLLVRRGQLRLRGIDFDARDARDCSEADLRRIDMLAAVSSSLGMVDTVRGADFQTRHVLLALKTGEPLRVVRALALEAIYSATGGTRTAGRTAEIVARLREAAARVPNDPVSQAWALAGAAVPSLLEGRWKEATERLAEAAIAFRERCAGQAFALDSINFYLLAALVQLGEMKELGRRIPALLEEATERGDRYALTQLRSGVLSMAWLARGDPEGARREADDAIRQWSKQGTHLPHFLDVLAQAQIDLYEGRPRAAYARVCDKWEALQKAFLLRVQFIRIRMVELRGRAALAVAAAGAGDVETHLREVERCAAEIAAEGTRWGAPLATLLRAGASAVRGETDPAKRQLASAEDGFASERMGLQVAVCRWRLAERIDAEGKQERAALLRAAATTWMQEQGVVEPERLVQTIAPWRGK